MKLTRRHVLGLTMGAAAFAVAGGRISPALASVEVKRTRRSWDFTGGVAPGEGKITLTAPENCRKMATRCRFR